MNVLRVCTPYTGQVVPFEARSGSALSTTRVLSSSFVQRGRRVARVGTAASVKRGRREGVSTVVCGLGDFWGADLARFDLDKWYKDVEDYGSIAVYAPHEGGYEGRYYNRLRREGYYLMTITARGLGDPEAYLSKVHGVRPAHLGKQAIECFYLPPEIDYRLSLLPENSKGLVLWVIEAKVLSKTELQYLALLPALNKKVKVIAECGTWRSYRWKPLRVAADLPLTQTSKAEEESKESVAVKVEGPTTTATDSETEVIKSPVRAGL